MAGGGISNQDYNDLSPEIMDQLVIFDRTITVPRQIVSVRPELVPGLEGKIQELLLGLKQTEEGREILKGMKETTFDPLPLDSQKALDELMQLIRLLGME